MPKLSPLFTQRLLSVSAAIMLLTACSTMPTAHDRPTTKAPKDEKSWEDSKKRLNQIKNWHVSGKIAVRTSKDSGSANVDWQEMSGRYVVALTGPMGAGAVTLKGTPSYVTLYTADGKKYSASSAEALLSERWGFRVPIANIRYWIKGVPVPGIPASPRFDLNNRLATLTQGGVTIQYSDYTKVSGYELPKLLSISSGELKTKIAIHRWQL